MYTNIHIPSEDESARLNKEFLSSEYEEGLRRREVIVNEMSYRINHRSFEAMIFGGPSGSAAYSTYRMNGSTNQMTYGDFYNEWRNRVITTLSASSIPSHLRLAFMTTPNVIIDSKYRNTDRNTMVEIITQTLDNTLAKLLEIISQIPDTAAKTTKSEQIISEFGVFAVTKTGRVLKNSEDLGLRGQQRKIMAALIAEKGSPISRTNIIEILWNEDDGTEKYLDNPLHTPEKINKAISTVISKLNDSLRDAHDRKKYVKNAPIKGSFYLSF